VGRNSLQPERRSSSRQRGHILGFLNGFGFNPLLFPMAVMFLISGDGGNG
jgi:hypothetical protein